MFLNHNQKDKIFNLIITMNNNLTNNNEYAIEMFNLAEVYQNIILDASSINVPINTESG